MLGMKIAGAVKLGNQPLGVRSRAGTSSVRNDSSRMLARIKADRRSRLRQQIDRLDRVR